MVMDEEVGYVPNKQDNYGNMEAIMMIPEAPIHKMKKDATLM